MKRGRAEQFNQKVEAYRKALLYHSRTRDWQSFKVKAGRMFDYMEAVEHSELERRFYRNFSVILAVLTAIVVALFKVNVEVVPELIRFKNMMVLAGLGVSSFELYFYIDYRVYMRVKMVHYTERRERFIRNIEKDFEDLLDRNERTAA